MTNPNNIDVIVESFATSDGLAQLISGTNENANDDLKLRVFCKALREVIDMVNGWKFLDARPNVDGFTIQRKTPENDTDVMMLAYDSGNIHVWLQQFTKFAIDIIVLLAPTKAITPINIDIDMLVRFDRSVQQEISLCALLDSITTLTNNGLRYRRRGRVTMAIGIAICLLVSFIYGLSLSTAISLPIIGGFGGALKQLSIGCASSHGKLHIHCVGREDIQPDMFKADQIGFIESMADAASAVAKHFGDNIVCLNAMVNLSVDCDCCGEVVNPELPCMKDIGILASTDPIAIDQACIDLIWSSDDPGRDHFIERVKSRHGRHILEAAAKLGFGSREYELVEI